MLTATGVVVTAKVADVALAATVTVAGTCAAAVLLLDNVTTAPPAGAGPFRVTVPVDEFPPSTETGLRLTKLGTGAVMVKLAVCVEPSVAEIANVAFAATGLEVTVKVAVVAPALTVTLAGTWAAPVLLLDRATTAPPAGAAAVSVTDPVDELPPTTDDGLTVTVLSANETKLNADTLAPLIVVL